MWISLVIVNIFALCQGMLKDISFELLENSPIGTVVGNIKLSAELFLFQQVDLSLESTDTFDDFTRDQKSIRNLFKIDNKTSDLITVKNIDREVLCRSVSLKDSVNCSVLQIVSVNKLMWINVYIRIIDINDNRPRFRQQEITLSMSEISKIHSTVQLEEATDLDSASFGPITYSLLEKVPNNGHFQLQRDPLKLILLKPLDYESVEMFTLLIVACDAGVPNLCGNQNVFIKVINENDEAPVFRNSNYTAIINEDAAVGQVVLRPKAYDRDKGDFGKVKYSISSGYHLAKTFFIINKDTGDIVIKEGFRSPTKFKFSIEAKDEAPNPLIGRTWILLHIVDVNNNIPIIQVNPIESVVLKTTVNHTTIEVPENNRIPLNLAFITVTDADQGENARCVCQLHSNFKELLLISVNEVSERNIYRLVSEKVFDAEILSKIDVSILCNDHGEPQNTVIREIEIQVKDENEYSPTFEKGFYEIYLKEDVPLGSVISHIKVHDRDIRKLILLDMTPPGSTYFDINVSGVVTTKTTFDYEKWKSLEFFVMAIDRGIKSFTSSVKVCIIVEDVNDNAPEFETNSNNFEVYENIKGVYEIGRLKAYDRDSLLNAQLRYYLLNTTSESHHGNWFTVDPVTGVIHSNVSLDYENCTLFNLSVRVVDCGIPPLSTEQSVYVHVKDTNDNGPQWQYPNHYDHFLNISISNIRDSMLTRVRAVDIDSDQFNIVHYYLLSHKHILAIDRLTGVLSLRSKDQQPGQLLVQLRAVDSKAPDKYSSQSFIVHIHPDYQKSLSGISAFGLTFPMVLSIVGVSSLISVVLVVTLFFFCCRKSRVCRHCLNSHQLRDSKDCLTNTKSAEQQKKMIDIPLDLVADKDGFNDMMVEDSVKLMFSSLNSSSISSHNNVSQDYEHREIIKEKIFRQQLSEDEPREVAQNLDDDYYRFPGTMISLQSTLNSNQECCMLHSSSDEDCNRYTDQIYPSDPRSIPLFPSLESPDCLMNSYATFVNCDCRLQSLPISETSGGPNYYNRPIAAPFIFNGSAWIPTESLTSDTFIIHAKGDSASHHLMPLKSIMKKKLTMTTTHCSFVNVDSSSSSGQFNDTDQASSAYDSGCIIATSSDNRREPSKSINLLEKTYQCKKSQV